MADVFGEATDRFSHHIATGGVLQGIGYVILEPAIVVNGQRLGGRAVPLQAINTNIVHFQCLGQVARQRLKEVLA